MNRLESARTSLSHPLCFEYRAILKNIFWLYYRTSKHPIDAKFNVFHDKTQRGDSWSFKNLKVFENRRLDSALLCLDLDYYLNRNRLKRRSRQGSTKSNCLFSITLRCLKDQKSPQSLGITTFDILPQIFSIDWGQKMAFENTSPSCIKFKFAFNFQAKSNLFTVSFTYMAGAI